jgi:chromate transport protein ChrA
MQETTTSVTGSTPIQDRWSLVKIGTAAVAAAAVLDVYAAYGDSQRQTNQTAAVPFLIAVCAVVAALVFGVVVPKGLRAVQDRATSAGRWALGTAVASAVLLVAFWSGLPLVVGAAGALLGRRARDRGDATRPERAALPVSVVAMVVCVVVTIIGNAVHP